MRHDCYIVVKDIQYMYCYSVIFLFIILLNHDHNRCGQRLLFSHSLTVFLHQLITVSVSVWHWPDLRGHGHSHPTVIHGTVGPMFAMTTPVSLHHHQKTDGITEKKKKKEEKDREKREKEKDKVSSISSYHSNWWWLLLCSENVNFFSINFSPRRRTRQHIRCFARSTELILMLNSQG